MKSRCTGTGVIAEYEPGELVKIKSNIKAGDISGRYRVTRDMAACAGLTLAIEGRERVIDGEYYKIAGVYGYWWTQELFEPVEQFSSGGIVPVSKIGGEIVNVNNSSRYMPIIDFEKAYEKMVFSCGTISLTLGNARKNKSGIESRKEIRKRLLRL